MNRFLRFADEALRWFVLVGGIAYITYAAFFAESAKHLCR